MSELNKSGKRPLGRAVMLLQSKPKAGRFVLPKEVEQTMVMQDQYAVVVEIGPLAWMDEPTPRCKVGDKVVFSKYAGFAVPGDDEQVYRCVNDRDIFMSVEE
jgi:co-chaperonin GroES (HSP10)